MGMAAVESQFHVLAVDDSIIDRKLIERLLKTSSYQVTTVDSGTKALEFLGFHDEHDLTHSDSPSVSPNNHQYVEVNLIITDYCMPGMNGYELLKKIKESSSLRNIPVVIMSSENVPSRINRCLEEGAEEFFLKPVQLSDLIRLRPHMMKTKFKDQHFEAQQQNQPIKQQQQQQQDDKQKKLGTQQTPEFHESEILHIEQQQQQIINNNNSQVINSNKRKAIDETLSPDRTRPRHNGLTTFL